MALKMRYLELNRKSTRCEDAGYSRHSRSRFGTSRSIFLRAEIMGVLYFHKMKHKPSDPLWEGRDYFVNSKAHSAQDFMQF